VKGFAGAKARLAPALSPGERATLARAMAVHTMGVVAASGIGPVYVVTNDRDVSDLAAARGLGVLHDDGYDHSSAMRAVGARAMAAGADRLVTLAADLPLLTPGDVVALCETVAPGTFVIGPDRAGTGTNAIAVDAPTFPFSFGPGSRERHITIADELGLRVIVLEREGLALDVDEPTDLDHLAALGVSVTGLS
jgi:2-phospho-L-lactate guanylyltransferase